MGEAARQAQCLHQNEELMNGFRMSLQERVGIDHAFVAATTRQRERERFSKGKLNCTSVG